MPKNTHHAPVNTLSMLWMKPLYISLYIGALIILYFILDMPLHILRISLVYWQDNSPNVNPFS